MSPSEKVLLTEEFVEGLQGKYGSVKGLYTDGAEFICYIPTEPVPTFLRGAWDRRSLPPYEKISKSDYLLRLCQFAASKKKELKMMVKSLQECTGASKEEIKEYVKHSTNGSNPFEDVS